MYQLRILKRDYSDYSIVDSLNQCPIHEASQIDPWKWRLVDGDIFSWTQHSLQLDIPSSKRSVMLPAVLILDGNRTYGRMGKKMLYRCLPDDPSLPAFLVPYEVKTLGFSKVMSNKYVLIQLDHWRDKHPLAKLQNVFGDVENLEAFADYQMTCKGLAVSMQHFYHQTVQALSGQDANTVVANFCLSHSVPLEPDLSVFTIDPEGCRDFDDAFSVAPLADGSGTRVSVYISHVPLVLDHLQLWDAFAPRVSTIYLPHRILSMLPTKLSEDICSLRAGTLSLALAMHVEIKEPDLTFTVSFSVLGIRVRKNFVYDSDALLQSNWYQRLLPLTQRFCADVSPLAGCPVIQDSHDVVAYWMLFMNREVATRLATQGRGVFRTCSIRPSSSSKSSEVEVTPSVSDPKINSFLQLWRRTSSAYVRDVPQQHALLQLDAYLQITSPIRRLPDLLNMILFHVDDALLSSDATGFCNSWLEHLDKINHDMKRIRALQNDCSLLHACTEDPSIVAGQKEMHCVVFDREDVMISSVAAPSQQYSYQVYVPELNICCRVQSSLFLENYQPGTVCNPFVFTDEVRLKRKIRLALMLQHPS